MKIILICVLVLICALRIAAQNPDIDMVQYVNGHRNHFMDRSMREITNSATPVLLITPVAILATGLATDDPDVVQKLSVYAGSVVMAGILSSSMKLAVRRNRPFEDYPESVTKLSSGGSYSFPSGHTSAAFSSATALSLVYPKWYVVAPAMTWAGLVGYSRVYLGVHYPSDVLAGALVGSGSAFASYYINKKFFTKKPKKVSLALSCY
jgi:membrane-associated phospholipid phosphatase